MNTAPANSNGLAAVFPTGITVQVPHADGSIEEVKVMPLPLKKWADGFDKISVIGPLFGFDLTEAANETNTSLDLTNINQTELGNKVVEALTSSQSREQVYDFLCFATNLPRTWWDADDLYEAAIDVVIAVIEVNLIFFVHKLLPKIVQGMTAVMATGKQAIELAKAKRK